MGYKMAGIPSQILGISKFSTWEPWEKWHLGVAPVANHRE